MEARRDDEPYENEEALKAALEQLDPFRVPIADIRIDLTSELGRGGYSVVRAGSMSSHTAGHPGVNMLVAVKMLDARDISPTRLGLRSIRECYLWSQFQHPNIHPFIGFHIDLPRKEVWLISPLLIGGTIKAHLKYESPEWLTRVGWVLNIAQGLGHLHSRLIAHGDLKPDNILINIQNEAVLTDFGLATGVEDEIYSGLTTSNSFQGALRYASPECLDNEARTVFGDVWSFAMVSLEILTSRAPFHKLNDFRIIEHIVSGQVPENSDYPELQFRRELWSLLLCCWEQEPTRRPSMTTMIEGLSPYYHEGYHEGPPVVMPSPPPAPTYHHGDSTEDAVSTNDEVSTENAIPAENAVSPVPSVWLPLLMRFRWTVAHYGSRVKSFLTGSSESAYSGTDVAGARTTIDTSILWPVSGLPPPCPPMPTSPFLDEPPQTPPPTPPAGTFRYDTPQTADGGSAAQSPVEGSPQEGSSVPIDGNSNYGSELRDWLTQEVDASPITLVLDACYNYELLDLPFSGDKHNDGKRLHRRISETHKDSGNPTVIAAAGEPQNAHPSRRFRRRRHRK